MSWAHRRGPPPPNTGSNPPVQMYNPNQHSNTENQWQTADSQAWNNTNQQQQLYKQETNQTQNCWPQSQQSYPVLSQTPNANNSAQYQQYKNVQAGYFPNPPGFDQQAYGNPQYNQQYNQSNAYSTQFAVKQPATEGDTWGNWTWGDEDNANAQSVLKQPAGHSLEDSFANDESWNWSVSDSRQPNPVEVSTPNDVKINELFPKVGDFNKQHVNSEAHGHSSKPNRNKLETPQWSTESQPSLESSDDVLHTSESDKSHMISRSSTISHSPISGQESSSLVSGSIINAEATNSQYSVENKEIVKQELLESRPVKVNPTPPPPKNMQTPPLFSTSQGGLDDSRNPYKRATGLSHKSANKFKGSNSTPPEMREPLLSGFNNQTVNLETLPDNSEHPDHPLVSGIPKTTARTNPQWVQTENNEAPINDRNQYLETGQLSDVGVAEANEVSDVGNDTLPPPGLQRMVPGQLEQNETGGRRLDELLPGFSRMVLGQNEMGSNVTRQGQSQYDLSGPPEGLHRMVPGESSSPETSLHQPNVEENDSEVELNQLVQNINPQPPRSATIGADTPPIVQSTLSAQPPPLVVPGNRTEAIGGGDLVATIGSDVAEMGPTKGSEKENHRELVEGHTNETNISNLTNTVRNLTVGENLTDGQTSNASLPEHSPRRHSRQESSDSDSDKKRPSRNHRDKRSAEKLKSRDKERERYKERDGDRDRYKDRDSDRYSPSAYRDKRDKRDRRYRERKYEEDTDYYSDKEKDRRTRDDRERDYERKYGSLRKEKDRRRKDREPRDPRDYRDLRRKDYYYGRYGDDYGPERSSRPSSRSDSLHESYRERRHETNPRDRRPRERDRERDHYRSREHRDAFNPYQGYAYDPYNPYYQQYQYYENLRRTNPQAYAEWYRKYYQQATGSTASFTEDRASVHSGRSSANDELTKDSLNRTFDHTDNSFMYEQQATTAQRLTPAKFITVHMKASINSGKLIRILPNYPMDGQNATVEVRNLQALVEDDLDYQELRTFPGPLVKGVTHKKQIIEYCDNKIKGANYNKDLIDVESYILMWELLILLIRQNGMVVGTDIAELLLKNRDVDPPPRPSSALSTTSSNLCDRNEHSEVSNQLVSGVTQSVLKEEEITRKFREFLLYGSCKEALEWAMKHGLWGHALFLASKLDKRTYANVMMRFANGLTINDPLQTLYQLLSGKMPAAVTCISDEKWGDWRPHLAMILSNSTHRPDLNCRAITQLGDTLLQRGSLYAAQFCYLMAEVGFGKHDNPVTKLVLLGSDHRKSYPHFVTNEAIHMTEIYEFACSLNDQGFVITEFQFYKYILATRLADFGLLDKALQYLEKIAGHIIYNPSGVSPVLIDRVCELSDKLKFYDPVGDVEDESEFGGLLETSRPDNSWLKELRAIQTNYQLGKIVQDNYSENLNTQSPPQVDVTLQPYNSNQDAWQQQQFQYDQQQQQLFDQQQQAWQAEQPPQHYQSSPNYVEENNQQQQAVALTNQHSDQQNYWPGQQTQSWDNQLNQYNQDSTGDQQQQIDQPPSYYESMGNQSEDFTSSQPQISMPNQIKAKTAFDEEPVPHETQKQRSNVSQPKPQSPVQENKQTTGWFGGIFSKLSMKPKNQMKLPDDKNPKIVWDQDKKRWTNVDEDPNDPTNDFKPPPKMTDMMPKMPSSSPPAPGIGYGSVQNSSLDYSSTKFNSNLAVHNMPFHTDQNPAPSQPDSLRASETPVAVSDDSGPPRPSQPNMFKLQRGRNLKNSYVDLFKHNGTTTVSGPTSLPGPDKVPAGGPSQMNFFIPQPVNDPNAPVDFLTPGGVPVQLVQQQQ